MNNVFVLDKKLNPLMPCHPARARELLRKGKAAVYRRAPFTIILLHREGGDVQPIELKIAPCSKATGLALVALFKRGQTVVFAAELTHRGWPIHLRLLDRNTIRSSRRNRRTRYRQPRFSNRSRPKGWLAPSLQSRVANVVVWTKRLQALIPITALTQILHRFDTQKLQNPEIAGVEYQRGELFGYEVREYLLEKWGRLCAYCDAKNVPLQIEHIRPKSLGGTDRVSNLTLACGCCNQAKDNLPVEVFLARDPKRLKRILAQAKAPLKDVAAINSTRLALAGRLKQTGLPLSFGTGGQAKFNRTRQDYPKAYWIDAACAGATGSSVSLNPENKPLHIAATGRGQRQVVKMNAQGFPRTGAGRVKRVRGFQTGDLVRLVQPKGKYAGTYTARLAGIRADGRFDIKAGAQKITANWQNFTLIQRGDGYAYA